MCQVQAGAYVSLLTPEETKYSDCHPSKTTTYILHVVSITTHTHDRHKSMGEKETKKRKEDKGTGKGKKREEKTKQDEKGKQREEKDKKYSYLVRRYADISFGLLFSFHFRFIHEISFFVFCFPVCCKVCDQRIRVDAPVGVLMCQR